jgi:hemin uptake protein HemP
MDVLVHALHPVPNKTNPSSLGLEGPAPRGMLRTTSQALFRNAVEIHIQHDGVVYRLRKTSLGKLILTK